MAKMTKNQLIVCQRGTRVSKGDVKAVVRNGDSGVTEIEQIRRVHVPGFVKMSVVNRPATEVWQHQSFHQEPMSSRPNRPTIGQASPLVARRYLGFGEAGGLAEAPCHRHHNRTITRP